MADKVDFALLSVIENGMPLTPEPFRELGSQLGLSSADVVARIANMKEEGLIRQIGPIYEPRRLGYKTALVGVKTSNIDAAVGRLLECKGVSHAYERKHEFNLWFTMAVPKDIDIGVSASEILGPGVAESVVTLPALRTFKLQSGFACHDSEARGVGKLAAHPQAAVLSDIEKKVINALPYDLPLVQRPFDEVAWGIGISVENLLNTCRLLLKWGVMRRYSAAVNHWLLGLVANAMVCWSVPAELVSGMACRLISLKEVSHCYERETVPGWSFNLFAMIHASNRALCLGIIDEVSQASGQYDKVVLFSTRELVKRRAIYQV